MLTLENPDSDEVMTVDVMKRYRDLESGATSCLVEGCTACSIFSASSCQECSEELSLNKKTGQCDACVAHLYSEAKLEDIDAGWKGRYEIGKYGKERMDETGAKVGGTRSI